MSPRRWILYVEDNEDDVALLRDILPRNRFPVSWAKNGTEALERVREEAVDLVVLDYGLPDTNALLLLSEIRKIRPDIPVVVLTGRTDDALSLAALQKGATAYLQKDDGMEKIRRVIEEVLQNTILRIDETAAARAEHVYRTLVATLQEGVLLLDGEGFVTFANESAGRIVGIAPTELLGRRVTDLLDEASRRRLAPSEAPSRFEGRVRVAAGGEIPILLSVAPIPGPGGKSATRLLVFTEIAELVRSREMIRSRAADLERLQRFFIDRERTVIELKARLRSYERRLGIASPGLSEATRKELERRIGSGGENRRP